MKTNEMAQRIAQVTGKTMDETLRLAGEINTLIECMREGRMTFRFEKADGTIRTAYGTLKSDLVGEVKGTGRKPNPDLVTYWDLAKESWRSFSIFRFKEVA